MYVKEMSENINIIRNSTSQTKEQKIGDLIHSSRKRVTITLKNHTNNFDNMFKETL